MNAPAACLTDADRAQVCHRIEAGDLATVAHRQNHLWTFWVRGLGPEALAIVGFVRFFGTRRWM